MTFTGSRKDLLPYVRLQQERSNGVIHMAFTGRSIYSDWPHVPEGAEDVSEIVGLVSPLEAPLLAHLGDSTGWAEGNLHEWYEDNCLETKGRISGNEWGNPLQDSAFSVEDGSVFLAGDMVTFSDSAEVMLVESIQDGNTLVVERGFGNTKRSPVSNGRELLILGNRLIEGEKKCDKRFVAKLKKSNLAMTFEASVRVAPGHSPGIPDACELGYQKQERVRELVRDLENCVINGRCASYGIRHFIESSVFAAGRDGFPFGMGGMRKLLTQDQLDEALLRIWKQSPGRVDTIVASGPQTMRIGTFIKSSREMASVYESDFGVCRVILSRWVPADTVLLLDSSRVDVLQVVGRSFHYKKEGCQGEDYERGHVVGEYVLELRNESAHGGVAGLGVDS